MSEHAADLRLPAVSWSSAVADALPRTSGSPETSRRTRRSTGRARLRHHCRAQAGRGRRDASLRRQPSRRSIPQSRSRRSLRDGGRVAAGGEIARVAGNARALLTAERVALNFLGHLSGIATLTSATSRRSPAPRRASSTRARRRPGCAPSRNTPCAAAAASTIASGCSTRSSSRTITSSRRAASGRRSRRPRACAGHTVKIEVEVDTLDELRASAPARGRRRAARQHATGDAQGGRRHGCRPRRHRGFRRRKPGDGARHCRHRCRPDLGRRPDALGTILDVGLDFKTAG